jgi:hypothetical protein
MVARECIVARNERDLKATIGICVFEPILFFPLYVLGKGRLSN